MSDSEDSSSSSGVRRFRESSDSSEERVEEEHVEERMEEDEEFGGNKSDHSSYHSEAETVPEPEKPMVRQRNFFVGQTAVFPLVLERIVGGFRGKYGRLSIGGMHFDADITLLTGLLELNLQCRSHIASFNWNVKINVSLSLLHNEHQKTFLKDSHVFDISHKEMYCKNFTTKLMGLLDSDSIDAVLTMEIVSSMGFRSIQQPGYCFDVPDEKSSTRITFDDGKVIYVSCAYLAEWSDYFDVMLKSEWKDQVFDMKLDVDSDDFIELLYIVYPCRIPVNDSNVAGVISLADRFQFVSVLADCERHLANVNSKIDLIHKLQWACMYQMSMLESFCFQHMTLDVIERIPSNDICYNLSDEVIKVLFERFIALC